MFRHRYNITPALKEKMIHLREKGWEDWQIGRAMPEGIPTPVVHYRLRGIPKPHPRTTRTLPQYWREIARLLVRGYSRREVAQQANVSRVRVGHYITAFYKQTQARDHPELIEKLKTMLSDENHVHA